MSDQEVNCHAKPEDVLMMTDDDVEQRQKDEESDTSSNDPTQTPDSTQPIEDIAENQSPSTPDGSNESKVKPKKAQRTHRIQLPGPTNPTNAGANPTDQSAQARQSTNLESISHTGCAQVPVQIPPQIIAFHNDDCIKEESLNNESALMMSGLCSLGCWIAKFISGIWHFVKGLAKSVGRLLFTPALLGAVLYCIMVYMVFTFIIDQKDEKIVLGFDAALKYVLQNAMWLVLPIFVAFLVIHFNSNHRHHQFLYESMVDVMLMLTNSLIMACHAQPDSLLWLRPMFMVAVAFRFVYWLSLFYLQPKWQQLFHTPTILNCIILTVYNLGVSIQTNAAGFLGMASHPTDHDPTGESSTQEHGSQDSVTSGPGWF